MAYTALIAPTYFNVKQYGALGDGTTDDTTALTATLTAAAVNGGIVFFPAGTYISTTQTLVAKVSLLGAGIGITTLKLKNGANADLLSAQTGSINLSATEFAGATGTLSNFSIQEMTLDGNKANQTSGTSYPLRFYGYNFILRDIEVLNGYTGGALIDWNGAAEIATPSDDMEALIDTSKFHDNNGIGLQLGGPHDSRMTNVISYLNGSHNFHFAPNAVGILASNCHGYNSPNTTGVCCWLVEGQGCMFTNCVAEGAYACNLALLVNQCSWVGGTIFATAPNWTAATGIQLGQLAGQTPYPGQLRQAAGVTTASVANFSRIDSIIVECRGGALNCANESNNLIIAQIYQTVGTAIVGNTINKTTDTLMLNIQGLTTDATFGKSGGMNIATNGSAYALTVTDATNGQIFQIDQYGNMFINGGFNTSAGLYFIASNTAATLATGGTISLLALPNITVAPTADVTGIILQAGYAGQFCVVVNASAFTITFDVSGTSHVANGVLARIPANTSCSFYYNGVTSLWYSCSLNPLPTQSATAAAIVANGTITTTDTDVARVAPTAARAGIILQAGIYAGQSIVVINESVAANSITFDVSGTSHVAQGVSAVIAGLARRMFTWDSATSLWY